MKYLLLLVIVVVAYMLWRNARLAARDRRDGSTPPKPPAAGGPHDMVSCPVCSVHLPRAEAVVGGDGRLYCSQEHRLRAGG
jgi:uncharacterized protein